MATATRRRQPTEAQRAAAEARRKAMRELAQTVRAMSEDERASIIERCGAVMTIEGHACSITNTVFMLMQRDELSVVGGYRQWLAAGRQVRKGEHGIALWIPAKRGEGEALEGGAEDADGTVDDDRRQRFVLGTVFDISQTDEAEAAS